MKRLISRVILATFIIGVVLTKAEEQKNLGAVSRAIIIEGANKYKTFLLDEKVYEYADTHLADIRITNSKGENVPYYIEEGNQAEHPFKATKIAIFKLENENHKTYINIKNKEHLKINTIILETDEIFKRAYDVASLDAKDAMTFLESGSIYNLDLKSVKTKDTTIKVQKYISSDSIRVSIYNQDDAPLKIKEVKISYWIDKVVFAATEQETYTLWYGNKEALSPHYDIEEYKNYIKKEEQDVCALDELIIHQKSVLPKSQSKEGQLIFNILIMTAAGVLIFIVFKKLRND